MNNSLGEYSSFFSFQVRETIYTSKELTCILKRLSIKTTGNRRNKLANEELVRRLAKSINRNVWCLHSTGYWASPGDLNNSRPSKNSCSHWIDSTGTLDPIGGDPLSRSAPGVGGEGGGGGTWLNFCWVCAAGPSEALPDHSLFCGQL